jgi:DAACS family dicarboxylate/amino acid:cation (Na+ or H+) symporter/aerobic C4-dicarboxylate transport protein
MVLLLGVDRFMSEARAITNTIGNGVGTMAIAKWVGALDTAKMNRALDGIDEPIAEEVALNSSTRSPQTDSARPLAGQAITQG